MASCRPDYLLYPNMQRHNNTAYERSEFWRFLDQNGKMLPLIQDASRNEKKNFAIAADKYLWNYDEKIILEVLQKLEGLNKYVSFLEPISIEKLLSNETLRQEFLKLKIKQNNNIRWTALKPTNVQLFIDFYKEFKKLHPTVIFAPLTINAGEIDSTNLSQYLSIIEQCFSNGIAVVVDCSEYMQYPNYVRVLADFTKDNRHLSWLEYITYRYHSNVKTVTNAVKLWLSVNKWNSTFRELIRLTYINPEFCCIRNNKTMLNSQDVPWHYFAKVFKYNI